MDRTAWVLNWWDTRHICNACDDLYSAKSFTILDSANLSFQIKVEKAIYIREEYLILNQEQKQTDLSLSF